MAKQNNTLIIIGIILVLTIPMVSAMTFYEQEIYNKIDNFFVKLKYAIEKGLFLFTSWGQANCCSVYPDDDFWLEAGDRIDCDDFCSYDKCAFDIWYDSTIYLGGARGPPSRVDWDNWLGEEHGEGESFRDDDFPWYWVEVYCCPKSCDVEEEHSTRAYVCENYEWDYKGRYDYDENCRHDASGEDLCWCADEDDRFYVDESGGVHCRSSPRSSWCTSYTEHDSYTCYNNDIYWYDSNNQRSDKKEDCGSLGCVTGGEACRSEPECKTKNQACIPGLGQCCTGLTCYGICLGEGEYIEHDSKKCYNNDVYWYDSLGKRNDKYKECGSLGCESGQCKEPECTSHASKKCYNNDVYWYDSCGDREGKYRDCPHGCEGGQCKSETCTPHDSKKCYNNDVYWYDSCDSRESRYRDCQYKCENKICVGVCGNEEESCSGKEYLLCENNLWSNKGNVLNKCEVECLVELDCEGVHPPVLGDWECSDSNCVWLERNKQIYYRFQYDECIEVVLYDEEVTGNDYLTIESCAENIEEYCNFLYWSDDSLIECGYNEFCGEFTYEGLKTFDTLEECQDALPVLECGLAEDCPQDTCFGYDCISGECIPKTELSDPPCKEATWLDYSLCKWDVSGCEEEDIQDIEDIWQKYKIWIIIGGGLLLILLVGGRRKT